jgi:hypothetical protein
MSAKYTIEAFLGKKKKKPQGVQGEFDATWVNVE